MSENSKNSQFLSVHAANINHAMASFGSDSEFLDPSLLHIKMPLKQLACSAGYIEFWGDHNQTIESGHDPDQFLTWVSTEHHLLLSFEYPNSNLHKIINKVYKDAYERSHYLGFDHLLRTWNYIDQINSYENGQERYQTFCVARHEILADLNKLDLPNPAATAIGGHNGQNYFVFLFSHNPGVVVENKRQISAWKYPEKYAPKQPRFSRAMQYGGLLMCSGTASVIGHETVHLNDLESQFEECLINIKALIDESTINVDLSSGMYRFYLRDKDKLSSVLELVEKHGIRQYVVVEGEICRDNLLIECEAVFQ